MLMSSKNESGTILCTRPASPRCAPVRALGVTVGGFTDDDGLLDAGPHDYRAALC